MPLEEMGPGHAQIKPGAQKGMGARRVVFQEWVAARPDLGFGDWLRARGGHRWIPGTSASRGQVRPEAWWGERGVYVTFADGCVG